MIFRFLLIFVLLSVSSFGGPVPKGKPAHVPDWWFERDVMPRINPTETDPVWPRDYRQADDYAGANLGQLKNIAAKASEELAGYFPASPKLAPIQAEVARWSGSSGKDDYALANQGQLKWISAPYYSLLEDAGFAGAPLKLGQTRPWTGNIDDDDAFALANLGQLKWVYSFDLSRQFYRSGLVINAPPELNGKVGVDFSCTIGAGGVPPLLYSAQNLPDGLNIDPATGIISGVPSRVGRFPVLLSASNAVSTGERVVFIDVVAGPPVISSALAVTATQGREWIYVPRADYDPVSYSVTDLVSDISYNSADNVIIGTFSATGAYTFTLTATNAHGDDIETVTVTVVAPAPVFQAPFDGVAYKNRPYSVALAADYCTQWSIPSPLPAGLSFDAGLGRIEGTPTETGTFLLDVRASNNSGTTAGLFVLRITEPSSLEALPRLSVS